MFYILREINCKGIIIIPNRKSVLKVFNEGIFHVQSDVQFKTFCSKISQNIIFIDNQEM